MLQEEVLRGLIVPLVTPLREGGELDEDGFRRLVDFVAPQASAVMAGSPILGEGAWLGTDRRKQLLKLVSGCAAGRCRVLLDISCSSESETRELAGWASQSAGGGCILVDTPLGYRSNRGLAGYYEELAAEVGSPFILRNAPQLVADLGRPFKKLNIRTSNLKRLAENPMVVGVIHHGDVRRLRNYSRAVAAHPGFSIYDGKESKFLSSPSTSGVVAGSGNLLPEEWGGVVASSIEPREDGGEGRVRDLWALAMMLREVSGMLEGTGAVLLKAMLAGRGVIGSGRVLSGETAAEASLLGLHDLLTRRSAAHSQP